MFDLFETLVSEFGVGLTMRAEIAAALEIDPTEFAGLYERYRPERIAGRLSWAQTVSRIAQECGVSVGSDVMDRFIARRHQTFKDLFFNVESEIISCLDEIRASGFKTVLVSNTDGSDVVGFWESPLGPRFDAAIFSHDLGDPKPSPTMFLAACDAVHVKPADCIFVGDGGNNELSVAASLGITPLCAAWFLRRHVSELGPTVVNERSEGFPVLYSPSEIRDYGTHNYLGDGFIR